MDDFKAKEHDFFNVIPGLDLRLRRVVVIHHAIRTSPMENRKKKNGLSFFAIFIVNQ